MPSPINSVGTFNNCAVRSDFNIPLADHDHDSNKDGQWYIFQGREHSGRSAAVPLFVSTSFNSTVVKVNTQRGVQQLSREVKAIASTWCVRMRI